MPEFHYSKEDKSIELNIGDLVLFRHDISYSDRPTFGTVLGINLEKRGMPENLALSPSYRLFAEEKFAGVYMPGYLRSSPDPTFYRPHQISEIWTGSPRKLAKILRIEWENMEVWARIIKHMKKPYNLEILVNKLGKESFIEDEMR